MHLQGSLSLHDLVQPTSSGLQLARDGLPSFCDKLNLVWFASYISPAGFPALGGLDGNPAIRKG